MNEKINIILSFNLISSSDYFSSFSIPPEISFKLFIKELIRLNILVTRLPSTDGMTSLHYCLTKGRFYEINSLTLSSQSVTSLMKFSPTIGSSFLSTLEPSFPYNYLSLK
jgi:hypothetical protein